MLGVDNMRFHRGIAEGADNTILADVVFTLTEVHIKEQMAVLDLYNNRRRDHEQHKLILDALSRAMRPARAQLMTRAHRRRDRGRPRPKLAEEAKERA